MLKLGTQNLSLKFPALTEVHCFSMQRCNDMSLLMRSNQRLKTSAHREALQDDTTDMSSFTVVSPKEIVKSCHEMPQIWSSVSGNMQQIRIHSYDGGSRPAVCDSILQSHYHNKTKVSCVPTLFNLRVLHHYLYSPLS